MFVPVREFITDVPAPGSDHRKNEPATFLKHNWINIRTVRADLVRHVCDIEFHGPTARRFEVDEEQAVLGAEKVA